MARRKIVLCRHTRTKHNLGRILSGQYDIPLDETGRQQAETLANRVAGLRGICAVVSSDLMRAVYLGHRISQLSGAGFRTWADLREVDLGSLNGHRRDEFPERYRTAAKYRTSSPTFDFTEVGGEAASRVIARYERALRRAARYFDRQPGVTSRLVVVGHGTALRLVFKDHLGLITQLHEQGEYQEVNWPY